MELGVEFSSQAFRAGDRFRGTVWARVNREIRGAQLEVTVTGKEKTQANAGKSMDRDERTFLTLRVPVDNAQFIRNDANRQIVPGNYQFPFVFDLPPQLPSTMTYELSDRSSFCSIRYKIKVVLAGSGVLSPYKCERRITVKAQPDQGRPVPLLREPTIFPINTVLSRRNGTMSLGVALDNTRFSKGIPNTVKVVCRNDSPQDVLLVQVKLISRSEWRGKYNQKSSTRTLWTKTSHKLKALLQKLPPGVVQRGDDSVRDALVELMNELVSGENSNRILVETPSTGPPSYSGKLMKVWHELVIEVRTKSFVTNPTITIPVELFESPGTETPTQQPDTPPMVPLVTAVPADFENNSIRFDEVVIPNIVLIRPAEDPDVVIAATAEALEPSIETLLQEMEASFHDLFIIRQFIQQSQWETVFTTLSPADYGRIIAHVNNDFDQPEVAEIVALKLLTSFSCAHVASALQTTAKWNRTALVERLVLHCYDLPSNHSEILVALHDEWEQISAQQTINNVLNKSTTYSL